MRAPQPGDCFRLVGSDIQAALERAVRLVPPLVADGCIVELLEEDRGRGGLHRRM